jgi:hypothetical protein
VSQDIPTVLAGFWQELLDVDAVRPGDTLLEVGGNSLIATMLANRIEATWNVRPSMADLMTSSFDEICQLCQQAPA